MYMNVIYNVCLCIKREFSAAAQSTKYLYIHVSLLTEIHNCQQTGNPSAYNQRPSLSPQQLAYEGVHQPSRTQSMAIIL